MAAPAEAQNYEEKGVSLGSRVERARAHEDYTPVVRAEGQQ